MVIIDATIQRGSFRVGVQAISDAPATGLGGPSGAGTTTLLYVIAGLIRPASGPDLLRRRVPPRRRGQVGIVYATDAKASAKV